MKTIEQHNRPGLGIFLGLPFLIGGCAFLYLGLDPSVKWHPNRPPLYFLIPFTSVFILIGLFLTTGVTGYILLPTQKKLRTYWGILRPLRFKEYDLTQAEKVKISKEVRRSNNHSYYVYPVEILLREGKKFSLSADREYLQSRERAEEIARECDLNLLNLVVSNEEIASAEVDRPFHEKVRAANRIQPVAPHKTRISVRQRSGKHILSNSQADGILSKFFISIVSLVLFFPVISFIIGAGKKNDFGYMVGLMLLVPFLISVLVGVLTYTRSSQVIVTSKELILIKWGLFKREQKIPLQDIADMDAAPTRSKRGPFHLIVITRGKQYSTGPFSSMEDVRYMEGLIRSIL